MRKKIILTFMIISLATMSFGCGKKVEHGNIPTTKDDVATEANTEQTTEQNTEQNTEQTTELGTEVTTEPSTEQSPEQNTEPEEDDYNPNGYGFSIGQDCLNVYLTYVSDGQAEWDYERAEKANVGNEYGHKFAYFSIAGMAGDEPFLLLSSTNGNRCGDETYFVTYTPYDYSGEGIEQTHMQGNYEFGCYDNLSMRQVDEVNTIYVWASNPMTEARFIQRVDMRYNNDYDGTNTYDYEGSELSCNEKGRTYSRDVGHKPSYYEEKLASGELVEIRWFSVEQIEEARAYYQQYVREEIYDGPVESANREDYFNDNTVLKYFDYISEGVFEITEDADGDKEYRFSCLEFKKALEIMRADVAGALTFTAGSASQDVDYYLLENADGSWVYIKRHWCSDGYGDIITYSYETNENQIIFWFNQSGYAWEYDTNVTTVTEIIERLKEKQ